MVHEIEIEDEHRVGIGIVGSRRVDCGDLSESLTARPQAGGWKASRYGGKLRPEQD